MEPVTKADIKLQEQLDDLSTMYGAGHTVIGSEWNERTGEMFHVYKGESLESALKKYFNLYPRETALFVKDQIEFKKQIENNGMSKEKTNRLLMRLPANLQKFIETLYPHYLLEENTKKLRELIPLAFTK